MPVHGGPASGKTHPFAASRQASSTASPTARWSAWLTGPSSPQVRSKLVVMTTWGSSVRNAVARSRRSDRVRRHARDASLALGDQQVTYLLPLAGPAGNGRGHSVLQIVGVRYH